jgi:hypothetical protein
MRLLRLLLAGWFALDIGEGVVVMDEAAFSALTGAAFVVTADL